VKQALPGDQGGSEKKCSEDREQANSAALKRVGELDAATSAEVLRTF